MISEGTNSNELNVNVIQQSYMLNTVTSVVDNDIETGRNNSNNSSNNSEKAVLKGILKKSNSVEDDTRTGLVVIKICTTLLMIVLMTPIVVCDLYFGFTDLSCSREQPDELAITVKLYLIVSGFVGLSVMTAIFIGIACFDFDENYANDLFIMSCCSCGAICLELFNLVWNILGAVVFWEYIYGNGNCNKNFSTYVFVSLIIKFISILFGYQLNKKNNDRN